MQKINEITIVRHYKGKTRTVIVGVYTKRRKAIVKALQEKYGMSANARTWFVSSGAFGDCHLPISILSTGPGIFPAFSLPYCLHS